MLKFESFLYSNIFCKFLRSISRIIKKFDCWFRRDSINLHQLVILRRDELKRIIRRCSLSHMLRLFDRNIWHLLNSITIFSNRFLILKKFDLVIIILFSLLWSLLISFFLLLLSRKRRMNCFFFKISYHETLIKRKNILFTILFFFFSRTNCLLRRRWFIVLFILIWCFISSSLIKYFPWSLWKQINQSNRKIKYN